MTIQSVNQQAINNEISDTLFKAAVYGSIIATISAVALGIIFGLPMALCGFCAGGLAGAFVTIIACSFSNEAAPDPFEERLQKIQNYIDRLDALP